MTPEKVLEVIGKYRRFFEIERIPKVEMLEIFFDMNLSQGHLRKNVLFPHCHWMLDKIEEFAQEGLLDKAYGWLCFIQGCLLCVGAYTLDELRNHNRPNDETAA